jgi:hypothetical protein
MGKTSAKDVAELKDFVRSASELSPWSSKLTNPGSNSVTAWAEVLLGRYTGHSTGTQGKLWL